MEEFIHYTRLFDLYSGLFTEHQVETFKEYFFENLTLEEIALNNGTSKNAISKTIKVMKESLDNYERKLHFFEYFSKIKIEFKNEEDILKRIEKYDNIVL